jgi:KaiC/GvpD/RAD55 family RecA-like ATPase/ribosomal protein L37E
MANFVKHTSCNKCGSSDGLAIYSDSSEHCFVCGFNEPSEEYKENNQKKVKDKMQDKQEIVEIKSTKPALTPERNEEIKSLTTVNIGEYRGIREETYKYFGVRHEMNGEELHKQYYPCTQEGQLVGYKVRTLPKTFGASEGRTGADVEMFGAFRFNRGGKYVLLCEGEVDSQSAYQMLKDYNRQRNSEYEIAAVSPTTGANSSKQIASQYKFFDSFEQIIICYDNDAAGKKATEEIIKHLPKGKVKVMQMRYKDANEYLQQGKDKEFIQDFWAAKTFVPVGVLPSGLLHDRIISQSVIPKVPFPPFMKHLNDMFVGGMPLGYIFNIAADTGIGKTTFVNEMIYYWIFNSPHKVGIVSMELDAGQYGEVLLSRHLSKKLALMGDTDEKIDYLKSDYIIKKSNELFINEQGQDRFFLLDNRDGTLEEIQDTIEELVVACGAKVIVIDPLQDLLDGLTNEEQAVFMKWAKGFIKSHGVSFVLINHMRKSENSGEMDIMGSSTIIKSAAANIIAKRDKLAEDPIVRNTTTIFVPKNRVCGLTGPAGAFYYDNESHTLYDLDEWLSGNITM